MPYKQVYNPTAGILTKRPPFSLDNPLGIGPLATPFCKGVQMRDGEVFSEYGTSQFPVASATATNKLAGSIMKFYQLVKTNGTTNGIMLTTTNAYEYNTVTDTWDNITQGETIDNCEAAWTASANVTASNDTSTYLRGSKSVKLAIAAAFTTGVAGYRNFSSDDFSGWTDIHFWIYSDIALAAADCSIRLSDANGGATSGSYVDFDLPAIGAGAWTPCCVTADMSSLSATLSVSLVVNVDNGAQNIYIDDIRGIKAFTGDEDNRFSVGVINDTMLITNGVDQPQQYDGTAATGLTDLTTTLNVGTLSTSEIVLVFKDHVIWMNNTENGADAPQRVTWGNIGATADLINGTAGYEDLTGDSDWIIAAKTLGDDAVIIYKERTIVMMNWIGGQTPFRFTIKHQGDGCVGKDAIDDTGGEHVVVGLRYMYAYVGTKEIARIDENFGHTMFGLIDSSYINRTLVIYDKNFDELQIWVATSTAYPDDIWTMNTIDLSWYRRVKTATGFGHYVSQSSLKIGQLPGTIGELSGRIGDFLTKANAPIVLIGDNNGSVLQLDSNTVNNDGTAITNEFQTPDFVNPDQGSLLKAKASGLEDFFRVPQLVFEAKGKSVTTEWSDDSGASWNPTATAGNNTTALDSNYTLYQQDFDSVVRKIRFRFLNSTVSSNYAIRFYGFKWFPRSTRK